MCSVNDDVYIAALGTSICKLTNEVQESLELELQRQILKETRKFLEVIAAAAGKAMHNTMMTSIASRFINLQPLKNKFSKPVVVAGPL